MESLRECETFKLESDGHTTRLWMNGKEMMLVKSVKFEHNPDNGPPTLTAEFFVGSLNKNENNCEPT